MWEKRYKKIFYGYLVLAAVIRGFLLYDLPIYAVSTSLHDDGLMVNMAESLLNGQWIGSYSKMTLVKGIGYPLFLAISKILPGNYLLLSYLFYLTAVLVFIFAVKPVFKTRRSVAILYTILLFSPVGASLQTFQRIYRNSISVAQVLMILGAFAGMYFRRRESVKRLALWSIPAVIGLVSFYYTREDAIWILPYVIVCSVIFTAAVVKEFWKKSKKEAIYRCLLMILPLYCLLVTGKIIKLINFQYYRTDTVNELQEGAFAEMIKTIYMVEDEERIEQCSVSRSKLLTLYENSPTLREIQEEMDKELEIWCGDESYSKVWEVEDGWFFWILRDAISDAGYFTDAKKMSEFCSAVTEELQTAIEEGKLEKRVVFPSAMMSPWRSGYFGKTLSAMWELHCYANSYEGLDTMAAYSMDDNQGGIQKFEKITENEVFVYEHGKIQAGGWCASDTVTELFIKDENREVIAKAEWEESPDVAAALQNELSNAENCRFSVRIDADSYEAAAYLCGVNEEGEEQFSCLLETDAAGFEREETILRFDYCYVFPNNHGYVSDIEWKIELLNGICSIYQNTGSLVWILGMTGFAYVTVCMFRKLKRKSCYVDTWLVLAGIFCSYLVLLGGIGYTHVSAFDAVNSVYLSAAYPMIGAFCGIGILKFLEDVKFYIENRKAQMECQKT